MCESWVGEGGGRGRIDPLTIIDSHLPHHFAIAFTPTPHTIFSTDSVWLFVRASDCREVASDWLYRRWQQKGKYKILLIFVDFEKSMHFCRRLSQKLRVKTILVFPLKLHLCVFVCLCLKFE